MRIATFNVNGIRAAERRGFVSWLGDCSPDVVLLQEMRCQPAQLPDVFTDYWLTFSPGTIAGRNGVAILTRHEPAVVRTWDGKAYQYQPGALAGGKLDHGQYQIDSPDEIALEDELSIFVDSGRWIEVDLADSKITVASLYLPKGDSPLAARGADLSAVQERYDRKMRFLKGFTKQLDRTRQRAETAGRQYLVAGDFNIAHENLDLKNWKANQKSSGFLPEERQWFTELLATEKLFDVTRELHPDTAGPYSWWSWRGKAFDNDAGWRIDYQLTTRKLADSATKSWVDKDPDYKSRVSDHAPVVIDYAI